MKKEIEEYLAWKATYTSRAAINYRPYLEQFVRLGPKDVSDITPNHIVLFRKWLDEKYTATTVSFALIIVKNFLTYLREIEVKSLSPRLVKIPRCIPKSHATATLEDYKNLIAPCRTDEFWEIRNLLFIQFLWETGIRVSELCDLNLDDIDTKRQSALIRTKKGNTQRRIFWSGETHDLLLKYLGVRICLNQTPALFIGVYPGGSATQRLEPRQVQRIITKMCHRSNLKKHLTPHSFRHGWACYRRDRGASLAFIQTGLGHSNPISTFVYQQYNDTHFEKEAKSYLK